MKNKAILLLLMSIGIFPISKGQSFEQCQKIYQLGLEYNDLTVATNAVYDIIALDKKYESWKDTLAILYFQRGGYDQCRRIAGEILEKQPKNTALLELKAVSEQSLGFLKDAMASYTILYSETQNVFHLYEMTTIQYSMKDLDGAEKSVSQLLSNPSIENEKISLSIGPNQNQEAVLRAAVFNLQGVIALEKGDAARARQSFNAALKIDPEFVLPKNNIDYLDKLEAEKEEKKEDPKSGKSGK